MTYNYNVLPGESFNIKTPGVKSFDDIIKNIKSDGEVIINHSLYPNGFEIKMTQLANKIIISTNMELVKKDDGFYYIKEN
mgnify:CR=1 FL=1